MRSNQKQSRHILPTQQQLNQFNMAAREAILLNNFNRAEKYRRLGASVMEMARAVGESGNWDYAEFLLKKNPQLLPNLANELGIGFMIIHDHHSAEKLINYGGNPEIITAGSINALPTMPLARRRVTFLDNLPTPAIKKTTSPTSPISPNKLEVTLTPRSRNTFFGDSILNKTFSMSSSSMESFTLDP
ncbi:MAG: hypothetical protein A3E82_08090 [Gammaproteobacteria bacterium RIFCSPHIGHO2_12_FULL_38_11]|nr:MAG: hypothetical protein A3E82_08090 [Gammaproteobacteria bacterium RIFCSPHIGHO2_12_FULL_38_11]